MHEGINILFDKLDNECQASAEEARPLQAKRTSLAEQRLGKPTAWRRVSLTRTMAAAAAAARRAVAAATAQCRARSQRSGGRGQRQLPLATDASAAVAASGSGDKPDSAELMSRFAIVLNR